MADAETKLLLHMNGSDASTTFTDDSNFAHTDTAIGNAQIDTAQSQFGGASGLFDGAGDYVEYPDSTDWDFGTNDMAIDCWIRFNSLSGNQAVIGRATSGSSYSYWQVQGTSMRFRDYNGANNIDFTRGVSLVIDTWYHIAISRSGSNFRMFVDGVQQGATFVNSNAFIARTDPLQIGANSVISHYFNGHIDEMRVSNGDSRFTANFTPPTQPYDSDTLIDVDSDIRVHCGVNALSFDGINDTVNRAAPAHTSYPISYFCRAKLDNTGFQYIFVQSRTDTSGNYTFLAGTDGGAWRYDIRSNVGPTKNQNGWVSLEAGTADQEWHNFIIISTSSNEHEIFVDGVSIGTSSVNAAFPSGMDRTSIANWIRSGSNEFGEVSVSEVAVWDSVLSAPDIALLNNNLVGQSILVSPGNLKVSWLLNEFAVGVNADGATITDASGNGFDGTGVGTDGPVSIQTDFCLADIATDTLDDISSDIRAVHSEALSDVDTDIRAIKLQLGDVDIDIRAIHNLSLNDVDTDIRTIKLQLEDIDTDVRVVEQSINDVDTDIRTVGETTLDVPTDIRIVHTEIISDINTDIRTEKLQLDDVDTDIRAEHSEGLIDVDTDIRVDTADTVIDINTDIRGKLPFTLIDIDTDVRIRIAILRDIDNDIRVIRRDDGTQITVNEIYFVEGTSVCDNTVNIRMDVDGAINMQFRLENEAVFSAFEVFSDNKEITLSVGDGNKSVFIQFQDIEGAVSAPVQLDIVVNSSTPTGVNIEAYEDETAAIQIFDSVFQNDKGPFFRWTLPIFDIPYTGFSFAMDSIPTDSVSLLVPDMVRDGIIVTKATPAPEMTLDISSGNFYVTAALADFDVQTLLLSDGGGQDRIDLIYLDGLEHIIKSVEGVESGSPVAPVLPNLNTPIALSEVLIPAGTILINDVTITDIRQTHVTVSNFLDTNLETGIHQFQVKAMAQCGTISDISIFNIAVANNCPQMGEILGYTDGTKTIQLVSNIYQTASSGIFLEWTPAPTEPGPMTYYYTTDGSEPTLASSSTSATTLNLGPFSEGITRINIKAFDDTTGNSCATRNFIFVFGAASATGDTLVIGGGTILKQSLKQIQVNTISWNFDSARICKIFQPSEFDDNLPFSLNDDITVVHNDVTVFSGKVRKIDRTIAMSGEGVTYICTGPRGILTECYAVLNTPDGLDSSIITFENEPVGSAITSIINTVPNVIKSVQSLPTGSDINASYQSQSVEQAIQNLFIRTKYGWYIKPDGTFVSVAADVINPNQAKFGVYGTVVNSISPQFNVMDSNLQFDVSKRYNRAIVEGATKEELRNIGVSCLASESHSFYFVKGDWGAGDFTKYKLNTEFKVTKVIETKVSYKRLLSWFGFATPAGSSTQTGTHYTFLNFEICDNNQITKLLKPTVYHSDISDSDTFPQGTLAGDNILSFPREAANIWFRNNPHVLEGDLGVDTGVGDTIVKYCAQVTATALIETTPLRVEVSSPGTADSFGSKTLRIVDTSFKLSEDPDDPIDDTARMTAFALDKLESLKDVKVNGTITLDTIDTSWTLDNSVNLINTQQGAWTSLNAKVVAINYNFDRNTTTLELTSEFLK